MLASAPRTFSSPALTAVSFDHPAAAVAPVGGRLVGLCADLGCQADLERAVLLLQDGLAGRLPR